MAHDYYTRKYEDAYSVELTERVRATFEGNDSITEAFFALHSQFDSLIEEHDVFLNDGEHQVQDDWTPELVIAAVDEAATLARQQNSPAWPALTAIAVAMRCMVRTACIMPETEFKQDEAEGIPPGLFALMQKEDARPIDLVVSAIAEDMSKDSLVNAAVLAERARCEAFVKDRIDDLLVGRPPEDLGSEEGWFYEQLERVRSEIACEQPADEQPAGDASQ